MRFLQIDCSDFFCDIRGRTLIPLSSSSCTVEDILKLLTSFVGSGSSDLGLALQVSDSSSNGGAMSGLYFLLENTEFQSLEDFNKDGILYLKLVKLVRDDSAIPQPGKKPESNHCSDDETPAKKKYKGDPEPARTINNIDIVDHGVERHPEGENLKAISKKAACKKNMSVKDDATINLSETAMDSVSESLHVERGFAVDVTDMEVTTELSKKEEKSLSVSNKADSLIPQDLSQDLEESVIVTRIHNKRKRRHKKKERAERHADEPPRQPVEQPRYIERSRQSKHMFFKSDGSGSESEETSKEAPESEKPNEKSDLLPIRILVSDTATIQHGDRKEVTSCAVQGQSSAKASPNPVFADKFGKVPAAPSWVSTPQGVPDLSALLALKNSPVPKVFRKHDIYSNKSFVMRNSPVSSFESLSANGSENGLLEPESSHLGKGNGKKLESVTNGSVTKPSTEHVLVADGNFVPHKLDYSKFPSLILPPSEGSVIAFRKLELDENYSPTISDYQQALVISSENGQLTLRRLDPKPKKVRSGKLDLQFFTEPVNAAEESDVEECSFPMLMSPVLLKLGQPE